MPDDQILEEVFPMDRAALLDAVMCVRDLAGADTPTWQAIAEAVITTYVRKAGLLDENERLRYALTHGWSLGQYNWNEAANDRPPLQVEGR